MLLAGISISCVLHGKDDICNGYIRICKAGKGHGGCLQSLII